MCLCGGHHKEYDKTTYIFIYIHIYMSRCMVDVQLKSCWMTDPTMIVPYPHFGPGCHQTSSRRRRRLWREMDMTDGRWLNTRALGDYVSIGILLTVPDI